MAAQPQAQGQLRVLSLLPSATDTVVALQLQHLLVGRSHECDWEQLQHLPAATSSRLGDSIPVEEIDAVMVSLCGLRVGAWRAHAAERAAPFYRQAAAVCPASVAPATRVHSVRPTPARHPTPAPHQSAGVAAVREMAQLGPALALPLLEYGLTVYHLHVRAPTACLPCPRRGLPCSAAMQPPQPRLLREPAPPAAAAAPARCLAVCGPCADPLAAHPLPGTLAD